MTIIDARSLSPADIHHLGTNLAAVVRRDRHDSHVPSSCPAEPRHLGARPHSLIPMKKEPVPC